ncbi:MAG: hypothetical protein MSIBF_05175 [Candidatus Altiarchaeales archaeon IMC4]|nr:MAG: hypothetical protein MSIBF_05175 [Candidatus Altiarchaeales archaeon IMC4]
MEIEIEFISPDVMKGKKSEDRIAYILDRVKSDKILVVEERLSPAEEGELIKKTMSEVSDDFAGIEVSTLGEGSKDGLRNSIIRALGGSTGGLTVVGPSKLVKKVKKEPQKIFLLAGGNK